MKSKDLKSKRLQEINTIAYHGEETIIRGKDEWGNDFMVIFDSYNLYKWINIDELRRAIMHDLMPPITSKNNEDQ